MSQLSPDHDKALEPLQEEPEKADARRRAAEDEDWRRRYDEQYGEPPARPQGNTAMPKRDGPQGAPPELRPEHARPLDPARFKGALERAMAAAPLPHARLHERINPHVGLRDGDEETALTFTDTPMNPVLLTMRACYADRLDYQSAAWRFWALGDVIRDPRLAPWILAHDTERLELHDAVIAVAATAPMDTNGAFWVEPFCAAVQRWAAEHPDINAPGESSSGG
jgi:hypothetical protein